MKIVIEGAGEVGSHLAKMLSGASNDITIIDSDETKINRISGQADVVGLVGEPSSVKVLMEAGGDKADMFIAVNPDAAQAINIVSAILAKKLDARRSAPESTTRNTSLTKTAISSPRWAST